MIADRRCATRRGLLLLGVFGAPASVMMAGVAFQASGYERQLLEDLRRIRTLGADTHLELLDFDAKRVGDEAALAAVVRLVWAPGMRQRQFTTVHSDAHQAYLTLRSQIVTAYTAVVAGAI